MDTGNSTVQNSTESSPPSLSFSILIALTYFLLFTATVVLYALVFAAMSRNRKDYTSPYYKYIVSLAVGEFLSAIYFGLFGALCSVLTYCPVSPLANTVITGLIQPGWPIEVSSDIAIAFDRFIAVCFYSKYASISASKVPIIIIASTWLYALVYSSPSYTLWVPMFYDPAVATMSSASPEAVIVGYAQMCVDAAILAGCVLLYTITCATLWRRRKENLSGNDATMRRVQRKLVAQGCGHFLMVSLNDALYNGYVLPYNSGVVASFISNVVFMLIPLNNVLLVLACNSAVRTHVRKLFRRGHVTPARSTAKSTRAVIPF